MSSSLHQRLHERIEEVGLSAEAVAKLAKLDRSYFQKLFARPDASPRTETLRRIATVLGVTEQWLMTGQGQKLAPAPGEHEVQKVAPELPSRSMMPLDVPVYGTAAGSFARGAFRFEGGIIDYVRRPPGLMGTKNAYALFVEGTSMEPKYPPGELIYIHPDKPARAGDTVVVQTKNGFEEPDEATLGIYVKTTEKYVVIRKLNPPAEIQIVRNKETRVHKVLTMNELFGV